MAEIAVSGRAVALAEQTPLPSSTLDTIRPMVEAGVSVHWLKRRSKAPVSDGWQLADTHSFDHLQRTWSHDFNVGIRPGECSHTAAGYLHLIDMDIRDPAQESDAWSWLLARWPDARSAPFVVSGSGGASRHLYFFTDRPFRSRKIARSTGYSLVFDTKKQREVKKHDWELEVFGTRKQVAAPPSIHPDTGQPYRWGRPIDWDYVAMGIGFTVAAEVVEAWGIPEADLNIDGDDDLLQMSRAGPMGLSKNEITATLADLPEGWLMDRDRWRDVGMALHHEYQGSSAGFDRWCEWSRQVVRIDAAKFDMKDQEVIWRSFGKGHIRNPIRMATLIREASLNRLARAHAEDLDEDLLAVPSTALIGRATSLEDEFEDLLDLSPRTPAASIAPSAAVGQPYDPEWRSYLQITEQGSIKPTAHNVELIVRHDPRLRGVIGLNEFTRETVQIAAPSVLKLKSESSTPTRQLEGSAWRLRDPVNGDLWSDSHDHGLRVVLEAPERQGGYGLRTSDRDLRTAINVVAHQFAFHPVRTYLNGLHWDGASRVERLFVDYLGAGDTSYHREAALLFMVGAVTRIYEPGHKFDFVPILEGLQGVRKSTFIRVLAKHWFAELEGNFQDEKGMVERMQGSWIVELPELQGFSKAEVTTIKGFISRPVDKVRLAYEKRAAEFPRQCVFIGSTNETEYLRDSTGGRRFWPIACSVPEIDTVRLGQEINQVWAEAKAMYDAWRLQQPDGDLPLYIRDPESAAEAEQLQGSRREFDENEILAGEIAAWLDRPIGSDLGFDDADDSSAVRTEVSAAEIWRDMMHRGAEPLRNLDSRRIGRALGLVPGWVKLPTPRRTKKHGSQRLYRRVSAI